MIKLFDILPPSIADKKLIAITKALDNALDFVYKNKNLTLLLPNLDSLPSDVLDHLAWQWHVDFYDINLNVNTKRALIRDSFAWHKIKGTKAAVQKILDIFMVNSHLQEWFEYGGNPYFFKIAAQGMKDIGDGDISFWRMLFDAKNVRSWLEAVDINLPTDDFPHYHAICEPVGGDKITAFTPPIIGETALNHAAADTDIGYKLTAFTPPIIGETALNHAAIEQNAGFITTNFNCQNVNGTVFIGSAFLIAGYEITNADLSR